MMMPVGDWKVHGPPHGPPGNRGRDDKPRGFPDEVIGEGPPPPPEDWDWERPRKHDGGRKLRHNGEFHGQEDEGEGKRGHHGEGRQGRKGHHGEKKEDRELAHLIHGAGFVDFLMWGCVFVAAICGIKSSKEETADKGRTYFRRAKFFSLMALLIGLMKLHYSFKLVDELKDRLPQRQHGRHRQGHPGRHGPDANDMSDDLREPEISVEYIDDEEWTVIDWEEPGERDGRHLRSSKDVFNFVKNNINEGVKQAKKIKKGANKVKDIYNEVDSAINDLLHKNKKVDEPAVEISVKEPVEVIEEPELAEEVIPEPNFNEEDAEAMLGQISDGKVFEGEDEENFEALITDMTAWMNKYAELYDDPDTIIEDLEMPAEVAEPVSSPIVGSAETAIEEPQDQDAQMQYTTEIHIEYQYPGMQLDTSSFSVSFTFYDQDWFVLGDDEEFDFAQPSMLDRVGTVDDWDSLSDEDWAYLIWQEDFSDEEIEVLFDELDEGRLQVPEENFEDGEFFHVGEDEIAGRTPEEWNELIKSMTASEFKKTYVDSMDVDTIFAVFGCFDEATISAFYEELTEADWRATTPAEWRAIGWSWPSQDFKTYVLDYCTADEIAWIFSNFSEDLYVKYYTGLTDEDWENFTPAEWRAAFITWSPSDFKQYIFDGMTTEEIEDLCELFTDDDMDRFFVGLTASDWKQMTDAEWRAINRGTFEDRDGVVEFIHYFNDKNMLWVVTEMASHATHEEIQRFYGSFRKEDYRLLSDAEWIAFKKGAEDVPAEGPAKRHGGPGFWDGWMQWLFGEPDHDRRAQWKQGREERRDRRHGKGDHGRGRRGHHGKNRHHDHRPKRREEPPEFLEWTLDEDDRLFMEWQDEMDRAFEEDWSLEMDEGMPMDDEDWQTWEMDDEDWDIIEEDWQNFEPHGPPPAVAAPHRNGIDMTTLDKRHGGRHLRCRWARQGGAGHGEGHRGWGRHHRGGRFLRHARCSILFGALSFTLLVLASLCVHKKSIRHRRQYERLSEVHDSAVERNLNEEERNQLYRQVAESSCRQRAALRRQMRV